MGLLPEVILRTYHFKNTQLCHLERLTLVKFLWVFYKQETYNFRNIKIEFDVYKN